MKQKILGILLSAMMLAQAYPPAGAFHDIAVDFQGTFSIIETCCTAIEATMTNCCAEIEPNFVFTWSIISSITAVADNAGVFTALEECCDVLEQDFAFTWTILADKAITFSGVVNPFADAYEVLNDINKNFCSPIFIMQGDVGTAGLTLANSGVYKLGEDIVFTPGAPNTNALTIAANNTLLDLQCFMLSQGDSSANVNGILVNPSINRAKVVNGAILNFTNAGISVDDNAQSINIENIEFDGNTRGIQLDGGATAPIRAAYIDGVEVRNSATAIEWNRVEKSTAQNILAVASSQAAFDIRQSFSNFLEDIIIQEVTASSGSAYGIKLSDGGSNSLENLQITGVSTRSTNSQHVASGIQINANEDMDKIIDAQICNIFTTSSARPIGIDMLYSLTASVVQTSVSFSTQVSFVLKWSPDGRYLAVGLNTSPQVRVYEFNGVSLMQVASLNNSDQTRAIDWSPDGRYLAVGGTVAVPTAGVVRVLEFSGTSLAVLATFTDSGTLDPVTSISWSPDGRYLAVGTETTTTNVRVLIFNNTAPIALIQIVTASHGAIVSSVDWSPNGNYLAIAGATGTGGFDTRVYSFNGITLPLITSFNSGGGAASVQWSPNGQYIAVAAATTVRALLFTGTVLTPLATFTHGANVNAVGWSPDGRYIAMTGFNTAAPIVDSRILEFTGVSLFAITSFNLPQLGFFVDWAPDGRTIAFLDTNGLTASNAFIYSALQFPEGHIIQDNIISAVDGPALQGTTNLDAVSSGRGMQTSSGENLISNNMAFDNDINYIFVAFEQYQEFLQNIKLRNEFPNKLSNVSVPPL